MLQVTPSLFSSFFAQIQSVYERLSPTPATAAPVESPVAVKPIDPLRLAAVFDDPRLAHRVAEVAAAEAELARATLPALQRRRNVFQLLHRAAVGGRPFDPLLLEKLLLAMDAPDARAFLGRWARGEFVLCIASDARMDELLRNAGYPPAGQIAFYAPPHGTGNMPSIILRNLPAMTDGNRADWVKGALERFLGTFHEEDHMRQYRGDFDLQAPQATPFGLMKDHRKRFLLTETMSLLREHEIRLLLGDAGIAAEAKKRGESVVAYLAGCAAQDLPRESWWNRLKAYLTFPSA